MALDKFYAHPLVKSVVFLGVILVNYLSNALPLGGHTTKEVSDIFTNKFVPAGFTFTIWGVIYLLLLIYLILSIRDSKRGINSVLNELTSKVFVITGLLNMSWLFCWHHLMIVPSVFVMLSFLVVLANLYQKVKSSNLEFRSAQWYYHVPFTIYLAWISVATIANVSALLVSMDLNFGAVGNEIVTSILICVASFLAIFMAIIRKNNLYGLVIMWAIFGIYSKQAETSGSILGPTCIVAVFLVLKSRIYSYFYKAT